MSKPRLFVGSSLEQIAFARAVHRELDHDADVTVWDQDVFDLSKSALESLLELLHENDFFAFIFAPDDVARIRDREYQVTRDNVIFELGLALGALGPERTFILMPEGVDDLHLPSDLAGITAARYRRDRADGNVRSMVAPACDLIRQAMSNAGERRRPDRIAYRIGISGSMSVGKKTLANALREQLNSHPLVDQVVVLEDVGRKMIKAGRTADKRTNFDDYAAYFRQHLANLNSLRRVGCVLHVRTLFDTIAYAEVNGNFAGEWMEMSREMARLCAQQFDIYFYIPVEPHVKIVNDGIRSTDPLYRDQIDVSICKVIREFAPQFVELRGTVEERVRKALLTIETLHGK